VAAVFAGAPVQRCRVHFLRNVLSRVPKGSADMVAAAVHNLRPARRRPRPRAARRDRQHARRQFPSVEALLREAEPELLAFAAFGQALEEDWSTNPLERLNKEIKRRSDVAGVFPNPAALLRLAGAVLVETHAELQVSDRRYLSEGSMATLTMTRNRAEVVAQPELIPA
jgi:putative transposase